MHDDSYKLPQAIVSQFSRKRSAPRAGAIPADVDADLADLDDDDVDEEPEEPRDETTEDRNAADEELLDALEDDKPDLVVDAADIKQGILAVEKVASSSNCSGSVLTENLCYRS